MEVQVKIRLMLACTVLVSGTCAADCVTDVRGKTICSNGQKAVVVNPNKATVTTSQKSPTGVTTVQNSNGTRAAYNPHTGNAAVAQKNANGVTTTQTSRGGVAKTKNGMGMVQGPNGTTCARGANTQGCKKP
jgi:hypothetical protein